MAAANPVRGHLGFEVAGANYTLAFSTNALCAIEEEFDLADIGQLETVLSETPSIRTVRKLFRLGLTDCQPDFADTDVGPLMDAIGGIEPVVELIGRALQNAFPEAAKGGTGNPPRRATKPRGGGRSSTPVGARSDATPSSSGA